MPRYLLTASLGILLAGTVALTATQQSATLTLRSGATVSGQLVDLGGAGFAIRVNGEDRTIPRDEVASVDFGGNDIAIPADARTLPGGTHLLLLRNGDVVAGEFYDVGGTNPLRITFRTATGDRDFSGNDVRRIYLTRVVDAPGVAVPPGGRGGVSPGVGRTVRVSSRTQWTSTGITVKQGQVVRFDASGEIRLNNQNVVAIPTGNHQNLFDARSPVPTVLQGALIGRVGTTGRGATGPAFAIGNQASVPMPASGPLFLGINDSSLNDNSGEYAVVIIGGQ